MIKEKLKWEGEMKYILFFLGMRLFIFNKFFPELREGILGDILITAIMIFAILNLIIQKRKISKKSDSESQEISAEERSSGVQYEFGGIKKIS